MNSGFIVNVMRQIIAQVGDELIFKVEEDDDRGVWCAGIRSILQGGVTCPLFDPINGEESFEASGPEAGDAIEALEQKLRKWFKEDGRLIEE